MASKEAVGQQELAGSGLREVADLFGGRKVLHAVIDSQLAAHDVLAQGLPGGALAELFANIRTIAPGEISRAVGVSLRTVQRRSNKPKIRLSVEQSGRAWKFAEILAKATAVLGGQEVAERWLTSPAVALDRRRPVDLLTSPAGVELVEQLLGRMEYGVYT
jgi:putative toxin-antitoxin system antitoxin component (TIGR02293 family)